MSCGGPSGLGGDVYQFPLYTHPDLGNEFATEYTPTITFLGSVAPVNGGTRAMTIIRNLVAAHVLERHP